MTHDATFYFANLGADVMRCVRAAQEGNEERYRDSLARAKRTLAQVRAAGHSGAYEEGLLLLRGLALARATPASLAVFQKELDSLIGTLAPHLALPDNYGRLCKSPVVVWQSGIG